MGNWVRAYREEHAADTADSREPAPTIGQMCLDCFNREVIGYAMADHMRAELVCDALEMATRNHSLASRCIFIPTAERNILLPTSGPCSPNSTCVRRSCARAVVRQRVSGIVQRDAESGARAPHGIPDPEEAKEDIPRYIEIFYKSSTNPFSTRLPDTARSPHRAPERVNGSMN